MQGLLAARVEGIAAFEQRLGPSHQTGLGLLGRGIAPQAQVAQGNGMGPVGVEDVPVEGRQRLVRPLHHRHVLSFIGAAGKGIEGFGLLCGASRLLPCLVVELHAARPVLVAEFALCGLLHLRGEGRSALLQAQGLHGWMAQCPRGIDGEDLRNLGKTRVLARVHSAHFGICG